MGAAAARRIRRSPFVWGLLARRGPRSFPLLSSLAPRELLVRTRSPSPRGNGSLALSPKLLGAPGRSPSTLSRGRKRAGGSAPGRRGAGGQSRREEGGLVRAPAGRTHTPFCRRGPGGPTRPGSRGRGSERPPGARGAGAAGEPAGGEGRRGRRPRGGGAQLCPLALGGGGAVCTPLRRSRSSADGWDLKFFLPLWKSGRRGGGVAMATETPRSPRGRPEDSGPLLLSCDGPFLARTRTSPSPTPIPVLQFRLPF